MKVFTTEPGVQFFTANTLKGLDKDRNGNPINAREAFCFETQHFPDSPNHPNFPTTVLKPGEKFESVTVYQLDNNSYSSTTTAELHQKLLGSNVVLRSLVENIVHRSCLPGRKGGLRLWELKAAAYSGHYTIPEINVGSTKMSNK